VYRPHLNVLADLFYPQLCVGCERRASDVLCRTCFDALPRVGSPVCGRSGLPTAFGRSYAKSARMSTSVSRAPLKYDGVGKQVVHALKYRGYKRVVGRLAAPLMLQGLGEGRFDAVVPVPLHRSRLRKRGFNQAELLARGRRREDESIRIGYTRSRAQLKGPGRTLGAPETGQRRRRLRGQRTSARHDPTRRRHLYHRSNHERMRSHTRSGRRGKSPRPELVQDGVKKLVSKSARLGLTAFACQHFSTATPPPIGKPASP
jgi:competence protein ComFC